MKSCAGSRPLACLLPLALLIGCGGQSDKTDEKPTSKRVQIDAGKLPELGEYLVRALDEQRIKVAPPVGWVPAELPSGYLVRFKPDDSEGRFPCILIEAEDYEEEFFQVTEDNVEEFVEHVQKRLAKEGKAKAVGKVEPVVGDFVGAFYKYVAKSEGGGERDRVFLETVFDGRKYSLQLHAVAGDAKDYIDHLYSVAAGIQFLKEEPEEPQPKTKEEKEPPEQEKQQPPKQDKEKNKAEEKPTEKGDESEKE